jgi:hypothetical protein
MNCCFFNVRQEIAKELTWFMEQVVWPMVFPELQLFEIKE